MRIANMLNKLLKECEESRKIYNKPMIKAKKASGPNMNNVDIFSMLSKAQEDFNTSRSSGVGGGGSSDNSGNAVVGSKSPLRTLASDNIAGSFSTPLGPDVTSQSVMDFFAKAKVSNLLVFVSCQINYTILLN